MTSRCAASFQKLKFNTKHTIYSTFLQRCSFKFVLLIQIRGHAVTYRSAVGHTVSRDANSQARVHQVWTLECSEMRNIFARACVSGLTHSQAYEWKSMEWKVQCDRPFRVGYCLNFIDSNSFRFPVSIPMWLNNDIKHLSCVSFLQTIYWSWIPWTKINRLHKTGLFKSCLFAKYNCMILDKLRFFFLLFFPNGSCGSLMILKKKH